MINVLFNTQIIYTLNKTELTSQSSWCNWVESRPHGLNLIRQKVSGQTFSVMWTIATWCEHATYESNHVVRQILYRTLVWNSWHWWFLIWQNPQTGADQNTACREYNQEPAEETSNKMAYLNQWLQLWLRLLLRMLLGTFYISMHVDMKIKQ